MPHGLRVYRSLSEADYDAERALAVATIVASARGGAEPFRRQATIDLFEDAGFEEEQAEILTDALACCFLTERFQRNFEPAKIKFRLVRAGLSAACADQFLAAIDPCVLSGRDAEVRASIQYAPQPGRVVMCDFSFLQKPEMQKQRRAIVVSKRLASVTGRCSVVPVSMHALNAGHPLHLEFAPGTYNFFHATNPVWALCDHVYTVGLNRLWQINMGRKPSIPTISAKHMTDIRALLGTTFSA